MNLQDKNSALEELAKVQQAYYQGMSYSPYQDKTVLRQLMGKTVKMSQQKYGDKSIVSEKEAYELMDEVLDSPLQTELENPILYRKLIRVFNSIEAAVHELNIQLPMPLIFGSVQAPDPNAIVWLAKDVDVCIIAFHTGIYGYLFRMSQLVISAAKILDEGDGYRLLFDHDSIQQRLSEAPAIYDRFLQVLDAMVMLGNVYRSPIYLPMEEIRQVFTSFLTKGSQHFLMGHEYGHVIAGHTSRSKTMQVLFGGEEIAQINTSWEQEFEADRLGLVLALVSMSNEEEFEYDINYLYWGIDFGLSAFNILEKALSTVIYGNEKQWSSATHPSSYERRCKLRESLQEVLLSTWGETEEQKKALIKGTAKFLKLGKDLEVILEILWLQTKDNFTDYYRRQVLPGRSWRPKLFGN